MALAATLALASCATQEINAATAVSKGCAAIQVFKYYNNCSGLTAHDVSDAWDVYRDLPPGTRGVVFHVLVAKTDGRVLKVDVIE
jgi:hypothetical protein